MTRLEKIEEVKKMRDKVRKRVDRLEDISDDYGLVPSLRALEKNRRKYDVFDPETHKIAIKNADGSIKGVNAMTDDELDKILKQGNDFLKMKTSSATGARAAIRKRTKTTLETLKENGLDAPVLDELDDIMNKGIQRQKTFLDKVGKDFKDFWDVVDYLRDKHEKVADMISNPNEYNDVFQRILDKLNDNKLKGASAKRIGKILAKELAKESGKIIKEEQAKARAMVEASGGALPDDWDGNGGSFMGNSRMPEDIYNNARQTATKRQKQRAERKQKRKNRRR